MQPALIEFIIHQPFQQRTDYAACTEGCQHCRGTPFQKAAQVYYLASSSVGKLQVLPFLRDTQGGEPT